MGAALAYYTIFALTPGLVIVMALAGLLLGSAGKAGLSDRSTTWLCPSKLHAFIGRAQATTWREVVTYYSTDL